MQSCRVVFFSVFFSPPHIFEIPVEAVVSLPRVTLETLQFEEKFEVWHDFDKCC